MTIQNKKDNRSSVLKLLLLITNVVLIVYTIIFAFSYSKSIKEEKEKANIETFKMTIESMKDVSNRYLNSERSAVREWGDYIESQNFTFDQTVDYIHRSTTHTDRYAHLVDLETLDAWSTDTFQSLDVYHSFQDLEDNTRAIYLGNLWTMYQIDENYAVLGKYTDDSTGVEVVSVGVRVDLKEGDHKKPYLLLRIIPVKSLQEIWNFPAIYTNAEVSLVTVAGGYVIESPSMEGNDFLDYISTYNFDHNEEKENQLKEKLFNNEVLSFHYKNAKNEKCYWYYSVFEDSTSLAVLGVIPLKELYQTNSFDYSIFILVCEMMAILLFVDGSYFYTINKKLKETAELANEASNAKTQFLSSMSHDIRTPMNAVIGMASLARENSYDRKYVNKCLDNILLSGKHLLTLINDILEISKIESGNISITSKEFDLDEMLDSLEAILLPQANSKNITLTVEKQHIMYSSLIGDDLRLTQIYLNLLTNAIKYTNPGGTVRFCIEERNADGNVILVSVIEDNGIGMSEEYQKIMYDSFSRETDSRTDKVFGSGLGLFIVKNLVDHMQGSIACESAIDKGTKFTVEIPLEVSFEKHDREKTLESVLHTLDFNDLHVLVAEDNELNWEIIHDLLEQNGIHTQRACNGKECVDILENSEEHAFDFVFMDIQMPIMNGYEATKVIRASKRKDIQTIPVVAMSADAFAEDVEACLNVGMNGHISKPIDFKEVMKVIEKYCSTNQ